MRTVLRILMIEDSENDALLVTHQIKKGGFHFEYERVDTAEKMQGALTQKNWDIILSDYIMPHFSGMTALTILKKSGIDIPFIVISGTIGEDVAVEAMKAGASDYIMKDNLHRLLPAIERELRESKNRAERKKAEEALKLSQKKYTQIVETANEGIWAIDEKFYTSFVNAQLSSILGYEIEEMVGYDIANFIFEEDIPDHKLKMENRRRGISEHYERKWISKKGQEVWSLVSATPIFDNEHHFKGSFAMITDITDRKRSEIEISRVNRALRMLSGTNKALVRITNEETLLNEVCRVVVELGGYCMAWVGRVEYDESKTLRPVAHAGVCAEYLKSAKVSWADNELGRGPGGTSIRTGQPCFVRNIPFDPSFAPWREVAIQYGFNSIIALPLICDGQPYGALGIYSCEIDAFDEKEVEILTELANDLAFGISDIHARLERAKAEHEILHSEKRFKELTDLLPQTIYEADLNGTITFANKTALTTFGYSYNDVAEGIQMVNLVSEKEKNDAIENMQRIVKGLPVHKTEFEMVRKDGTTFPALTFTGPIIHDNETIGLRGSIVDISERKRSEEELSRKTVEIENQNKEYIALNEKLKIALEKAEESDRLKTAFLQNMSHEIRTPMNSILGFAELLSFQNVSSADQVKYLKVIEQSGRRMLNIINNIIDISKIETGQTTLNVQEIHVNQMIQDIYVHFSLEAQAKNLKMSYHCGLSDEECTINTDHTKLFQILTNLIKNAIKFTLNGCVNFGYNKKGEFIEFFVHDTGIGIDPHQKPIIFERFRQGTASLSRSYEGAGLGLSISKSYVEQLGGKIWVESEVGMGSTFYFTTPCI